MTNRFAVGQKPGGWVEYQNFEEGERAVVKYLHAFYWAVTTLTTVAGLQNTRGLAFVFVNVNCNNIITKHTHQHTLPKPRPCISNA